MRALIAERYPEVLATYDAFPRPIYRIDACRYAILHAYGGLYVDLDVECFRPVDELLAQYHLVLSRTIGYNNAVIGSVAGHELWATALADVARRPISPNDADNADSVVESVGPGLLSRSIRELEADRAAETLVCPAYVFEPGTPYLDDEGCIRRNTDMSKSYACHHMDMRWLPQPRRAWSLLTRRILSAYFSIKQAGRRPL